MQTFVTSSNVDGPLHVCLETAHSLDSARLGKQRVECKQIYTALTEGTGWTHHPATKMWAGHTEALAAYGFWMCQEWNQRGFEDNMSNWFYERLPGGPESDRATELHREDWPWWFGHPEMVRSHRSKLMRKSHGHYNRQWLNGFDGKRTVAAKYALPYLWPDSDQRNGFRLSQAEFNRKDWTAPTWWFVDAKTRRVTF